MEGSRPRGRRRRRWINDITEWTGKDIHQCTVEAQDRAKWKSVSSQPLEQGRLREKSLYTVAFLLTLAYAMEALFRFRRRLSDAMNLDSSQTRVMSSRWMLLIYISAWVFPLGMATVLMIFTHNLKDNKATGGYTRIYPQQCSSCFADFRFNEAYCWELIEDGKSWHYVIRLMFLLPLMVVMACNMALYVLINHAFKQVAMRRGKEKKIFFECDIITTIFLKVLNKFQILS
ncbi:transmembrane protein 116-like [Elysia marginata]|uniref:Transmembrane protein 116-like n=1 Tax=Elysia marginata TaxID=1093978 RepID=A0AAV4F176_9GAST|nr:transmembrane protein 116-like [Elysia marginata]